MTATTYYAISATVGPMTAAGAATFTVADATVVPTVQAAPSAVWEPGGSALVAVAEGPVMSGNAGPFRTVQVTLPAGGVLIPGVESPPPGTPGTGSQVAPVPAGFAPDGRSPIFRLPVVETGTAGPMGYPLAGWTWRWLAFFAVTA